MPPRKKITTKEPPRKKTVARSDRFDRLSRAGKHTATRSPGRNSTAR